MIDKENFERQAKSPFLEEQERQYAVRLSRLKYRLGSIKTMSREMGQITSVINRFGDIMGRKRLLNLEKKQQALQDQIDAQINAIIELYENVGKP